MSEERGAGDERALHSSLATSHSSLAAALAAVGDGVGCEHWTLPDHDLPVALLEALGFARPIRQRIPRCSEHGCRYLGACAQQAVFEEGREGRAGRKFRLTAEGQAAAGDPARVAAAIAALPLAAAILGLLAGGERTLFELAWALVEPALAGLAAGEERPDPPSRADVRATLGLLAEHGYLVVDAASGMVRLAAVQSPRCTGSR